MVEDEKTQRHDYDQILWRLVEWLDRNIDLPPERVEDNTIEISLSLLTQLFMSGLIYMGISHEEIAQACGIKSTKSINKWQIGETVPDWDKIVVLGHIYYRSKINDFTWRNQSLVVNVVAEPDKQ